MASSKIVTWDYNDRIEAETFFLALAARHVGGQQQDATDSADIEDGDSDAGSCDDEEDSDILST